MSGVATNDRVQAVDNRIDEWWNRWRGNAVLDKVFFAATNVGEFSVIWHAWGVQRAIRCRWTWGEAARFSAVIGLESLLVNQGIKRLFGRVRPSTAAENTTELHLRQPVTSSFPSGHASAATVAAVLLTPASSAPWAVRLAAAAVSGSRVHVRLHHASDVAGGVATGLVLGRVARAVLARTRGQD